MTMINEVAVAQWVELVDQRPEGCWFKSPAPLGWDRATCQVSLSKILNPRIAPNVQLAPCGAATAISSMSCNELATHSGYTLAHE